MTSLDHITLTASDYRKSMDFYDATLTALGIKRLSTFDEASGYGIERPFFWLGLSDGTHPTSQKIHIAFAASSKKEVDDFYEAALKAGATSNGEPGYREQYHKGYYAAFVFDPGGHNIEVVYREA